MPVLLEIGEERVLDGTAEDELLDIAAQELIDEATRILAIADGLLQPAPILNVVRQRGLDEEGDKDAAHHHQEVELVALHCPLR